MSKAYEQAGVNIEAGYEAVKRMKSHVERTNRLGVMGTFGGFGGMFDLSALNLKEPVLISGTDGVGTKLKLAFMVDKHDTIGIDCVAMCVNDIVAQGAEPLYFLDYVAVGKAEPAKIEQIVKIFCFINIIRFFFHLIPCLFLGKGENKKATPICHGQSLNCYVFAILKPFTRKGLL